MITFHVESFREGLPELQTLLPNHYDALALNKEHVPLSPQFDIYFQKEEAGQLLYITARDAGRLVGYFVGFVAPHLHYSTCLTLTMDVLWLEPSRRQGFAGIKLVIAIENEAKRRGVQRGFIGEKMHAPGLGKILMRRGWRPVETYYSKWLGD